MFYFKIVENGYIITVGTCQDEPRTSISEAEYSVLVQAFQNKPASIESTDYRLREDLIWESFEVESPTASGVIT